MKTFSQVISEAAAAKLTHLEHIEDAVFDLGLKGGQEAIRLMRELTNTLEGSSTKSMSIQSKVDGAPSVVAGIDPESGKFFVGTKSVFNKTPKVNYTPEDVDKNHGNAPGLASKLKLALKHFPKMNINGILQGDFMFDSSDIKQETINNEKYITFTPNTITYAVPADSDLAAEIKRAKVGVAWHTTYTGNSIQDLKANFKINISSLSKSPDVWFTDTNFKDYSGTATLTKQETKEINSLLDSAEKELKKLNKSDMAFLFGDASKPGSLASFIKIFINDKIKKGEGFSGKQKSINELIDFIREKYQTQINKVKTDKAKQRKQDELNKIENQIQKAAKTLAYTFQWHDNIQKIKLILIKKMEKVNKIPAFIKKDDGYEVTGPEGFVAIDNLSNNAVKLVNRMEFSKNNFNALKNWSSK